MRAHDEHVASRRRVTDAIDGRLSSLHGIADFDSPRDRPSYERHVCDSRSRKTCCNVRSLEVEARDFPLAFEPALTGHDFTREKDENMTDASERDARTTTRR